MSLVLVVMKNITYKKQQLFYFNSYYKCTYMYNNSRQQKLNSPIKNCKNKIIDKFSFVSLLEIAVWLGSNLSVMNKTLFRKYSSAIRSNAFISHLKSGVITLLETEDCDGRKYFIFLTDTSTRACLNKFAVKKCDTHT